MFTRLARRRTARGMATFRVHQHRARMVRGVSLATVMQIAAFLAALAFFALVLR
jgi:hypothetical protein